MHRVQHIRAAVHQLGRRLTWSAAGGRAVVAKERCRQLRLAAGQRVQTRLRGGLGLPARRRRRCPRTAQQPQATCALPCCCVTCAVPCQCMWTRALQCLSTPCLGARNPAESAAAETVFGGRGCAPGAAAGARAGAAGANCAGPQRRAPAGGARSATCGSASATAAPSAAAPSSSRTARLERSWPAAALITRHSRD